MRTPPRQLFVCLTGSRSPSRIWTWKRAGGWASLALSPFRLVKIRGAKEGGLDSGSRHDCDSH